MTAAAVELERVDFVDGQVPLPGMPEDGVLFHIEPVEQPATRGRADEAGP